MIEGYLGSRLLLGAVLSFEVNIVETFKEYKLIWVTNEETHETRKTRPVTHHRVVKIGLASPEDILKWSRVK